MWVWILFIATAAVIIWAGSKLSLFADVLADKFHLSRSAVGVLLVSMVTTLPELSTSLGAVVRVGNPNLALGNNLGSVLFNLLIIAICDIVFRKGGILRLAHKSILPNAGFAALVLVLMLISLCRPFGLQALGLRFGAGALVVIAVYLVIFFKTRRGDEDDILPGDRSASEMSKARAVTGFAWSSVVVIAAGIGLAVIGDKIATQHPAMSGSFVGTLFLAIATSLPELTVAITSVRMGAYDLMLGNVMGANMLNVMVIAIADLVYTKEVIRFPAWGARPAIPAELDWGQMVSGLGGLAITGLVMAALALNAGKEKRRSVGWETPLIVVVYLVCLYSLYRGGA